MADTVPPNRIGKRQSKKPDRLMQGAGSAGHPVSIDDDEDEYTEEGEEEVDSHGKDQGYQNSDHTQSSDQKKRKTRRKKWERMTIDELRDAYRSLTEERDKYKDTNKTLRERSASLNKQLRDAEKEVKELHSAQQKIKVLQQQLDEQSRKHAKDQKDRARVESVLHAKIENDQYQSMPDDVVRHKFERINTSCSEWIKKWQSNDAAVGVDAAWAEIVLDCISSHSRGIELKLKERVKSKKGIGIRLVCMAILTRNILTTFFQNPFELLKKSISDGSIANDLRVMYKSFARYDTQKALAWRADTLRCFKLLLDPDDQDKIQSDQAKGLRPFCSRKAKELFQDLQTKGLLNETTIAEEESALKELTQIYHETAKLSVELWSRRLEIEIVDSESICDEEFSVVSEKHCPHRFMGLDEDNKSLDGSKIQMVIVPMLKALGPLREGGFREDISWTKAQVAIFPEIIEQNTTEVNEVQSEVTEPVHLETAPQTVSQTANGEDEPDAKRRKTSHVDEASKPTKAVSQYHLEDKHKYPEHVPPPIPAPPVKKADSPPTARRQVPMTGSTFLGDTVASIGKPYFMAGIEDYASGAYDQYQPHSKNRNRPNPRRRKAIARQEATTLASSTT